MRPVVVSVHQIGKVGSTSLVHTLESIFPEEKIFHTHKASEAGLMRSAVEYLASPWDRLRRIAEGSNVWSTLEFSRLLEVPLDRHDWRIINLTREPVGRDVSAFFQVFEHRYLRRLPAAAQEICRRSFGAADASVFSEEERAILTPALRELFAHEFGPDRYLPWYSSEVQGVFGVNVFSEPFDRDRGYTCYRRGAVTVLVATIEKLGRSLREALLAGFTGCPLGEEIAQRPQVELARVHSAEDKRYAAVYDLFRREKAIEPAVIDARLREPYARHFYSDDFLAAVRAKWT